MNTCGILVHSGDLQSVFPVVKENLETLKKFLGKKTRANLEKELQVRKKSWNFFKNLSFQIFLSVSNIIIYLPCNF